MLGSYGKMTKVETILNKSKQVQRVTVLREKNSADMSNRHDSSSIFAEIASNKNITNNWKFRKKERSKTHVKALQSVGTSNSGGEVLEQTESTECFERRISIISRSHKKITVSIEL